MSKPMAILIAALVTSGAGEDSPQRDVSLGDIEAGIRDRLCAVSLPEDRPFPGGIPFYVPWGETETCGAVRPTTAVDRAVEFAFKDALHLLRGVPEPILPPSDLAGIDVDTREGSEALADAFLADAYFRRVVVGRAVDYLGREGTPCSDCASPAPPEPRSVAWPEIAPYVAHFITPGDESVTLCDSPNNVALPEDDPVRLRAGLIVVHSSEYLADWISDRIDGIRFDADRANLVGAERRRFLEEELALLLRDDPDDELIRSVCASLDPLVEDLGLSLAFCREEATASEDAP